MARTASRACFGALAVSGMVLTLSRCGYRGFAVDPDFDSDTGGTGGESAGAAGQPTGGSGVTGGTGGVIAGSGGVMGGAGGTTGGTGGESAGAAGLLTGGTGAVLTGGSGGVIAGSGGVMGGAGGTTGGTGGESAGAAGLLTGGTGAVLTGGSGGVIAGSGGVMGGAGGTTGGTGGESAGAAGLLSGGTGGTGGVTGGTGGTTGGTGGTTGGTGGENAGAAGLLTGGTGGLTGGTGGTTGGTGGESAGAAGLLTGGTGGLTGGTGGQNTGGTGGGSIGQPCTVDAECVTGLVCDQSVCKICGHLGEACCSTGCRTGCCDDRVLPGSCVDLGAACSGGRICTDGRCTCPSAAPNWCPGSWRCTDFSTSNSDCGGCDIGCFLEQACSAGACVCLGGLTLCPAGSATLCADIASDPKNCGGCGAVCPGANACSSATCMEACSGATDGGCAKLEVALAAASDSASFGIDLGGSTNGSSGRLEARVYVQAGLVGTLQLYAEDSTGAQCMSSAWDLTGLAGWQVMSYVTPDAGALDPCDAVVLTRIGIVVSSGGAAGGWSNPTVVYVDAMYLVDNGGSAVPGLYEFHDTADLAVMTQDSGSSTAAALSWLGVP